MQLPENVATHNITECVPHPETGKSVINRIPESLRIQLNANAQQRALHSTGCELRFRLKSDTATLRIEACEVGGGSHGGGLAQLLFGDFSHTYFPVEANKVATVELTAPNYCQLEQAARDAALFHPRLARLLLPTHASICRIEIDGAIAAPEPGDLPSRRILNYGSSITQGTGALTSRENWASRCAHILGYDLINLGFGGGCHCEPQMADYLCQREDFDIAILETGINMLDLDVEMTHTRIESLIRKFAAAHPNKPTFCLGVFPCMNDAKTDFQGRAQEIRERVKRVVADIASPNLHFIEGRNACSHPHGMTTDLTHPSQAGMIEIGHYVATQIQGVLCD
jgi:hypothetical protein